MAKKKRRWQKRKAVDRSERIAATPETLAKLRPCPLKALLHDGRMQPDEYEAALQISEAFHSITAQLGYRPLDLGRVGIGHGEMGGAAERLTAIYLTWAKEIRRRHLVRGHVIVEWVDADRAFDHGGVPLLIKGCNLWVSTASDYDRARRAERERIDNRA